MIHEIHPVMLPGEVKLRRDFPDMAATPDELHLCDRQTIFYDVFLAIGNRELVCIGPPLLNLREHLLPLRLRINGETAAYKWRHMLQLFLLRVKLAPWDIDRPLDVSIDFNGVLKWQATIEANRFAGTYGFCPQTLQKDNKIQWIRDWIKYYRRKFGAEQIFLYDNGSAYQESLAPSLGEDVNIIYWNFPHGPYKYFNYKFCQIGAMNHFLLRFGKQGIGMNFDIDELLVTDRAFLEERMSRKEIVKFDSFWVSSPGNLTGDFSFSNFTERTRKPRKTDLKYCYRIPGHYHCLSLHGVQYGSLTGLMLRAINRYFQTINSLCSSHQDNGACRLFFRLAGSISTGLQRLILSRKEQLVEAAKGYFLHYVAISTNWKKAFWNRHGSHFTEDVTEDFSVVEILADPPVN